MGVQITTVGYCVQTIVMVLFSFCHWKKSSPSVSVLILATFHLKLVKFDVGQCGFSRLGNEKLENKKQLTAGCQETSHYSLKMSTM